MALLNRAVMRGALVAVILAAVVGARPHAFQETIENDVKAAYLFHFTKFVRWPAAAGSPDQFRICVVGAPRFAAALDAIIKGESADGRPMVRHEPASVADARGCQILFIGHERAAPTGELLAAVRDLPVLTVGDTPAFLAAGGVIAFARVGERLRFDVNIDAAPRAGLQISSNLLRVARKVEGGR